VADGASRVSDNSAGVRDALAFTWHDHAIESSHLWKNRPPDQMLHPGKLGEGGETLPW
jgi:hypothetical protein